MDRQSSSSESVLKFTERLVLYVKIFDTMVPFDTTISHGILTFVMFENPHPILIYSAVNFLMLIGHSVAQSSTYCKRIHIAIAQSFESRFCITRSIFADNVLSLLF